MNSEKVKEIKKALNTWKIVFHGITNADILTLINELESENERLRNEKWDCQDDLDNYHEENQQLKDRIAELEKENEILQGTKDRLTFADRIKLVDNAVERKLNQFAERLKEKKTKRLIPVGLDQPAKEVWFIKLTEEEIDETLKELQNG